MFSISMVIKVCTKSIQWYTMQYTGHFNHSKLSLTFINESWKSIQLKIMQNKHKDMKIKYLAFIMIRKKINHIHD